MQTFPAALRIAQCVATIAGADDALAAINTSLFSPGAVVMVRENYSFYVLHKDATSTADGDNVVAPAEGGPGRWFKYGAGVSYRQVVNVSHAAIPPQSSVDSAATVAGAGLSTDLILFTVLDTAVPTGVTIGNPRVSGSNVVYFRFANVTAATVAAATVALEVGVVK